MFRLGDLQADKEVFLTHLVEVTCVLGIHSVAVPPCLGQRRSVCLSACAGAVAVVALAPGGSHGEAVSR
jgi:hypothetical protein